MVGAVAFPVRFLAQGRSGPVAGDLANARQLLKSAAGLLEQAPLSQARSGLLVRWQQLSDSLAALTATSALQPTKPPPSRDPRRVRRGRRVRAAIREAATAPVRAEPSPTPVAATAAQDPPATVLAQTAQTARTARPGPTGPTAPSHRPRPPASPATGAIPAAPTQVAAAAGAVRARRVRFPRGARIPADRGVGEQATGRARSQEKGSPGG